MPHRHSSITPTTRQKNEHKSRKKSDGLSPFSQRKNYQSSQSSSSSGSSSTSSSSNDTSDACDRSRCGDVCCSVRTLLTLFTLIGILLCISAALLFDNSNSYSVPLTRCAMALVVMTMVGVAALLAPSPLLMLACEVLSLIIFVYSLFSVVRSLSALAAWVGEQKEETPSSKHDKLIIFSLSVAIIDTVTLLFAIALSIGTFFLSCKQYQVRRVSRQPRPSKSSEFPMSPIARREHDPQFWNFAQRFGSYSQEEQTSSRPEHQHYQQLVVEAVRHLDAQNGSGAKVIHIVLDGQSAKPPSVTTAATPVKSVISPRSSITVACQELGKNKNDPVKMDNQKEDSPTSREAPVEESDEVVGSGNPNKQQLGTRALSVHWDETSTHKSDPRSHRHRHERDPDALSTHRSAWLSFKSSSSSASSSTSSSSLEPPHRSAYKRRASRRRTQHLYPNRPRNNHHKSVERTRSGVGGRRPRGSCPSCDSCRSESDKRFTRKKSRSHNRSEQHGMNSGRREHVRRQRSQRVPIPDLRLSALNLGLHRRSSYHAKTRDLQSDAGSSDYHLTRNRNRRHSDASARGIHRSNTRSQRKAPPQRRNTMRDQKVARSSSTRFTSIADQRHTPPPSTKQRPLVQQLTTTSTQQIHQQLNLLPYDDRWTSQQKHVTHHEGLYQLQHRNIAYTVPSSRHPAIQKRQSKYKVDNEDVMNNSENTQTDDYRCNLEGKDLQHRYHHPDRHHQYRQTHQHGSYPISNPHPSQYNDQDLPYHQHHQHFIINIKKHHETSSYDTND